MNTNIISLIKNLNVSNIMNKTNKTLSIIKKSIPVYKEIRPYINHEKSIFKKTNLNEEIDEIKESKPLKSINKTTYNDSLTFFN